MKKPNPGGGPKTILGMPPLNHPASDPVVTEPAARSAEPKTTIYQHPSLTIAMQLGVPTVASRDAVTPRPLLPAPFDEAPSLDEVPSLSEALRAAADTGPIPPEFVPRQRRTSSQLLLDAAFDPSLTPLHPAHTALGRRLSRGLVIGSAGAGVLIGILVFRPDVIPSAISPIMHDAALGAENTDRRPEDTPPPPSSSNPEAAAAPPGLAALEKQAVEMLIANQFAAAHATYAELLAAAPSRPEYGVVLKLLTRRLRTESDRDR